MCTTIAEVDARLAELAALPAGWLDGAGVTPSPAALASARSVALAYQSLGHTPRLWALPDAGGVIIEDDEGTVEVNQAGAVDLVVYVPPPSPPAALTDDERAAILERMRVDRLRRGGKPGPVVMLAAGLDLDAIQARADAAYPGPWRAGTVEKEGKVWGRDPDALGGPSVGEHCLFSANTFYSHTDNRVFVAHARTDVPALVKALREARVEIARLAPRQRAGQLLFNALAEVDPDFAERIRGTELSPFYRDGVIAATLRAWRSGEAPPRAPSRTAVVGADAPAFGSLEEAGAALGLGPSFAAGVRSLAAIGGVFPTDEATSPSVDEHGIPNDDAGACYRRGDDAGRLRNLLATIHRDGGQHVAAVGIAQACIDAEAVARGERPRPVPTPVVCRDCAAPVDVLCDVCGTGRCSAHGAAAVCDDCEACDLRPVVRGIAARDAERTASRLCAIFTALGLAPATRPMDADGIPAGGAAVTAGACEVWVGADGSLGAVLRLDAPATDATP